MTATQIKPSFREAFRQGMRDAAHAQAEKLHTKRLQKALRRTAPNAEFAITKVGTWTQAEQLMSMGWELVSSEQRQWAGSDSPGRSAVLRYKL